MLASEAYTNLIGFMESQDFKTYKKIKSKSTVYKNYVIQHVLKWEVKTCKAHKLNQLIEKSTYLKVENQTHNIHHVHVITTWLHLI